MKGQRVPMTRWGSVATVVASLALGLWGLYEYTSDPRHPAEYDLLDLIYHDLQLFVLDSSPLEVGGPFPWQLQIARFLAPAATVYALFEAARVVFAGSWRRMLQRHMSGHAIVTGDTPTAAAIAAGLRTAGHEVVTIDAGDTTSLRNAGVAGARVVYACADDRSDSGINVVTVTAANNALRTRNAGELAVYAHVSDPTYALALRARHLSQHVAGADFFNMDELAARELVRRDMATFEDAPPRAVVAGLGAFGQALVVELARMWQLLPPFEEAPLITLVDPAADRIAEELGQRWPAVVQTCRLRPMTADLGDVVNSAVTPQPHRIYLCYDDEDDSMIAALSLAALWRGGLRSLVVRLDRMARLAETFGEAPTGLLDDLDGRLWPVDVGKLLFSSRRDGGAGPIHEDTYERFAQSVHHIYLRRQLARGVRLDDTAAMVPWERLDDGYRQANRDQARDIGAKLTAIGCTIAPRNGVDTGMDLTDDTQVESLAIAEHDRWMAERESQGWTFGEVRDEEAKTHPSIRPWSELTEADRDKDRDAVRDIPLVLADFGLQIVRLPQCTVTLGH